MSLLAFDPGKPVPSQAQLKVLPVVHMVTLSWRLAHSFLCLREASALQHHLESSASLGLCAMSGQLPRVPWPAHPWAPAERPCLSSLKPHTVTRQVSPSGSGNQMGSLVSSPTISGSRPQSGLACCSFQEEAMALAILLWLLRGQQAACGERLGPWRLHLSSTTLLHMTPESRQGA